MPVVSVFSISRGTVVQPPAWVTYPPVNGIGVGQKEFIAPILAPRWWVGTTDKQPAKENPSAVTAFEPGRIPGASSFLRDWYFRFHLDPQDVVIPNIIERTEKDLLIWNSYFVPKTLDKITKDFTAGDATTDGTVPDNWGPLWYKKWKITVPPITGNSLDGKITFSFGGEEQVITFKGTRTVSFVYVPQREYRESVEWKTDVIKTFAGEQRIKTRTQPRRFITYKYLLKPDEYNIMRGLVEERGEQEYAVPIWHEATPASTTATAKEIMLDTTLASYRVGGGIMLYKSNDLSTTAVVATVADDKITTVGEISGTWSADDTLAIPVHYMRAAEGGKFARSRSDAAFIEYSATWAMTDNIYSGATAWPQYVGYDVVDSPSIADGVDETIIQEINSVDGDTGVITPLKKYAQRTMRFSIVFSNLTREELMTIRRWIYSLSGKQRGFWLPLHNDDIIITQDSLSASSTIIAKFQNYSSLRKANDIMVVMRDGTKHYHRITSGSQSESGDDVLTLSAAVGYDLLAAEVQRVTYMYYVRLDADRVEINHRPARGSTIDLSLVSAAFPQ